MIDGNDIDWGDAGGWAQAIGNLAIWTIAVITLFRDRKRIAALEREAEESRQEATRTQAKLVSAWPDQWSAERVAGRCLNASSEPVYQVVVRALDTGTGQTAPPTRDHRRTTFISLMRPMEELPFVVTGDIPVGDNVEVGLDLVFQDAAGLRWWRQSDGTLTRRA
ncbi:hypothetical protein [Micromonospora sp. CPCC 205561]|uniref:hypothetical protein n=1 Tax=Micromonospora sp. CPCC 205561 TaxID=3122407 RepID=UPI002FF2B86E